MKCFTMCFLVTLSCICEAGPSDLNKAKRCVFDKLSEKDVHDIGYYTGTGGILLTGYVQIRNMKKQLVILDSLNFLHLVGQSESEKVIAKKIRDFRTSALSVETEKFNKLITTEIKYLVPASKKYEEEIRNRTVLSKYFKERGNGSYTLEQPPKDLNLLFSELLKQNIKIQTGGYLGFASVKCN